MRKPVESKVITPEFHGEPIGTPETTPVTPMHGGMGQGSLTGRDVVAAQHEETAKIEHAELEAAQAAEAEAARLEKVSGDSPENEGE